MKFSSKLRNRPFFQTTITRQRKIRSSWAWKIITQRFNLYNTASVAKKSVIHPGTVRSNLPRMLSWSFDHLIPRRRQIFSHNLSPEGNSWVTAYRITIGEVRSPSSAAISSIKYHGKIEYDKQNCLQHEKMQSGRKTRSAGYLLLPLYKNRCITKKFPIKKVLEMMDSGIKNHAKVEYDKQNCVQRETIQSGRKIRTRGYVLLPI